MSLDEFIAREAGASLDPTDADVISWYGENFTRLSGRWPEHRKNQVADFLRDMRREETMQEVARRLTKSSDMKIVLEPYRSASSNARRQDR